MAEYVRTRGGQMVHRVECQYAKTGFRWDWPKNHGATDDKQLRELIDAEGVTWLTLHSCVAAASTEERDG